MPDPGCPNPCHLAQYAATVGVPYRCGGVESDVDILFVGQAPGREEDRDGRPFIGKAGRLLDDWIKQCGLPHHRIAWDNPCRCVPWQDPAKKEFDRAPTAEEVNYCSAQHLFKSILRLDPKIIVPLGNIPLTLFTGRKGITTYAGKSLSWKHPESGKIYPVIPAIHPSAVLRGNVQYEKRDLEIFAQIKRRLYEGEEKIEEDVDYRLLTTVQEVVGHCVKIVADFRAGRCRCVDIDIEATGLKPWNERREDGVFHDVLTLHVSHIPKSAVTVPWGHSESPFGQDEKSKIRTVFNQMLKVVPFANQNAQFDIGWMKKKCGIIVGRVYFDPMHAAFWINGNQRPKDLEYLSAAYIGRQAHKRELSEFLQHLLKADQEHYDKVPMSILHPYGCQDADMSLRLVLEFEKIMEKGDLLEPYKFYFPPCVPIAAQMSEDGAVIDVAKLNEIGTELSGKCGEIEKVLFDREGVKAINARLAAGLWDEIPPMYFVKLVKAAPYEKFRELVFMKTGVVDLPEKVSAAYLKDAVIAFRAVLGSKLAYAMIRQLPGAREAADEVRAWFDKKLVHFSLTNNNHIAALLYEEWGLPAFKWTATGPSVDEETIQTLRRYAEGMSAGGDLDGELGSLFVQAMGRFREAEAMGPDHPHYESLMRMDAASMRPRKPLFWKQVVEDIDLILEHKGFAKINSTYVEGLKDKLYEDGRLHPYWGIQLERTSRWSCSGPSLQTQPNQFGIRSAFISRFPRGLILNADYAQLEVFILAFKSGDPILIEALREGRDVHKVTASRIYHRPEDQVDSEQRRKAKAATFGTLYGISAYAMAKQHKISEREAQDLIDRIFSAYPGVRDWIQEQHTNAVINGYTRLHSGWTAPIPEAQSDNPGTQGYGFRCAQNYPIQGEAATVITDALIAFYRRHRPYASGKSLFESKLFAQVHDSLVFDISPGPELFDLVMLLRKCMIDETYAKWGPVWMKFPLRVSFEVGVSWGEKVDLSFGEGRSLCFSGDRDKMDKLLDYMEFWDGVKLLSHEADEKNSQAVILFDTVGSKKTY